MEIADALNKVTTDWTNINRAWYSRKDVSKVATPLNMDTKMYSAQYDDNGRVISTIATLPDYNLIASNYSKFMYNIFRDGKATFFRRNYDFNDNFGALQGSLYITSFDYDDKYGDAIMFGRVSNTEFQMLTASTYQTFMYPRVQINK